MGYHYDHSKGTWIVYYSKRHPTTKEVISQRRCTLKEHSGSRSIKSEAEAKRMLKQLVLSVEERIKSISQPKWGRLWFDWFKAVESNDIFTTGLCVGALSDYESLLRTYTAVWEDRFLSEISKSEMWKLLHSVETEVSKTRAKKLRSAIDNVFRWAISSGRINNNTPIPTDGYKWTSKSAEKLPEILTRDQISKFLGYARELNDLWYPVWALAVYTGMRSGELYALKWDAVDFENSLLHVHLNWTNKDGYGPTKGRYWRSVPVESSEVLYLLKDLKLKSNGSDFVLPHFKSWEDGRQAEILRCFLTNCGLPSIRFHSLRACFATQLLRDGVAPAVVMKICGWKDLKTMAHYIRVAGIEIKGATKDLKFLSERETMGRVVELFGRKQDL